MLYKKLRGAKIKISWKYYVSYPVWRLCFYWFREKNRYQIPPMWMCEWYMQMMYIYYHNQEYK